MPITRRTVKSLLCLLLVLQAQPAAAYIDPGTGSAIFYVVTGICVSAYFGVRSLYYRAVDLLFRIRHRDQKCGIAIHCEDARYEITFVPIIHELARRGLDVTVFTMYERDSSFESFPENVTHKSIPTGMVGYAHLNNIEAVVFATTTPQLDVMTFRRSKRVRHYAIVQHALGECRYVRPFAYDYYDSVLCCGPIIKANIRRMEAIRNLPAKELLETGLPHYEALIDQAHTAEPSPLKPVVLVAPSWGPLSMFESFGTEFVQEIARTFDVIVRPHPQMKISQPDLYARILDIKGVQISTDLTPAAAMARASVLLSDISGIAHEFAFIYERPVLVIDRTQKTGGLEGEVLKGDSELKDRCREFIVPISTTDMPRISEHIRRALSSSSVERIRMARAQLVYNFGHASDVAAAQIASIYQRELAKSSRPIRPRTPIPGIITTPPP